MCGRLIMWATDKVNDVPEKGGPLDTLTKKLSSALGDDLISVVLFGSAAAGDHHRGFSDLNVLGILTSITPSQLRATEPIFHWWREQGNPSPLLLTKDELATSSDCFAIEFHDILDNHRILYGPDLLSGIQIGDHFYRAQVEHELRSKLLRLRQKASGILSDKDVLRRLLADSISTFCILFRHALILHGVHPPAIKREIVRIASERFGVSRTPFDTLLEFREADGKAPVFDPEPLLADYMIEIGKVIEAVDRV